MARFSTTALVAAFTFLGLARSQTSGGPCYDSEDPNNLQGLEKAGTFCECNGGAGTYSAIPSVCGQTSYQACTYSTIPPSSLAISSGYVPPSNAPSCVAAITVGSITATEESASQYVIASQTLSPGGPAITIASTPVSLASGGSYVVVGSSTENIQSTGSGQGAASATDSGSPATGSGSGAGSSATASSSQISSSAFGRNGSATSSNRSVIGTGSLTNSSIIGSSTSGSASGTGSPSATSNSTSATGVNNSSTGTGTGATGSVTGFSSSDSASGTRSQTGTSATNSGGSGTGSGTSGPASGAASQTGSSATGSSATVTGSSNSTTSTGPVVSSSTGSSATGSGSKTNSSNSDSATGSSSSGSGTGSSAIRSSSATATGSSGTAASTGPITSKPGSATVSATATSSSSSSTPTIPFGVYVTTISNKPYTLTYVSTTATQATTIIESDSSKTTTSSITAGGAIWSIPTSPPGWPEPGPPGPPPIEAPSPGGGGGGTNPLCLFGCGGGGGGGGGGSLPCVIDCGDGGNPSGSGSASGSHSASNTGSETGSSSQTSNSGSSSSSSSSASCTKGSAVPSCKDTVILSTSFASSGSSSTVITSTTTSCTTITTCSGSPTTQFTTTSTGSSSSTLDCAPTICANNACSAPSKRSLATEIDQREVFGQGLALSEGRPVPAPNKREHAKRTLPSPSAGQTVDQWMSDLFNSGNVLGAGAGGTPLVTDSGDQTPTSRYDAFGTTAFSAGMSWLTGCTAIVVASQKGVWSSHFWQGTFGNADTNPQSGALWTQFQNYVLNAIDGKNPYQDWTAFTSVPQGAFDVSENPQVLISTPVSNDPTKAGQQMFPAQVSAIQSQMASLIPGIQPGAIHTFTYKLVGNSNRKSTMDTTAKGKVLTNWDPNAYGNNNPGWQTWAEGDVAMQDKWGGSCSNNQKRQNGGSCSPNSSISGSSSSATASASKTGSASASASSSVGSSSSKSDSTTFSTSTKSDSSSSSVPSTSQPPSSSSSKPPPSTSSSSTPPPSTTTTPTSTNYCQGNQILGSCVAGKIPAPTGGLGCDRPQAFGGSSDILRYNTQSAASAAATYCSNAISSKVVLTNSETSMKPGIVPGAENGGNIALTVLYDDNYCMNSPNPGKIDFAALGQETCEQLWGGIIQACETDPSWSNNDPKNQGLGGVAGMFCGLWSVNGQPA